jgi:hypothetical protein
LMKARLLTLKINLRRNLRPLRKKRKKIDNTIEKRFEDK